MSVQDLNRVHRRYITLSNQFKSAWTFHQFIQGLAKVFEDYRPESQPADFQSVYGQLKQVSRNLTEATADDVAKQLDEVEERLTHLIGILLVADEAFSPALLRQFFQRVKNFDDNILSQLVKFYLYTHSGEIWERARLDKVDYLATKLCEEFLDGRDAFVARDHRHLREMAQGFWAALGGQTVAEARVAELCQTLERLRQEITNLESIDEVNSRGLVQRYRDFKHSLGNVFFQPKVLQAIIDTNLALKNGIHLLYRREEQRIIAEYQHVFELERDVPVDVQLGQELSDFRQVVERFEEQLQGENIRLDDLARLREQVRSLIPKLRRQTENDGEPLVPPREVRELLQEEHGTLSSEPRPAGVEDEYVEEHYRSIIAALDDTNPTVEPKRVALQPEVFGLGLEPREVVAYRRLYGRATCDQRLEEFLLRAAALRLRIEHEVDEIKGILDDSAVTREAPIFAIARVTCRHGDLFLQRFEHLLHQALLEEDSREGRSLQVLKIRLMRAYAGLWLMVHKDG